MPKLPDYFSYGVDLVTRRKTLYSQIYERIELGSGCPKDTPLNLAQISTRIRAPAVRGGVSLVWMRAIPQKSAPHSYDFRLVAESHCKAISRAHRHQRSIIDLSFDADPDDPLGDVGQLMLSAHLELTDGGYSPRIFQPFQRGMLEIKIIPETEQPHP